MAFASVSSTYAGDALKAYILKALIGGETLSTTGISVETNVKFKRKIKKLASTGIVQEGSCEFSPTSGMTISEGVLEPQSIKVNESLCFDEFDNLWDSADMAAGQHAQNVPAELTNAITTEFTNQASKEIEELIWQGNTDGSTGTIKDLIDGYEKILTATGATGSVKVSGTTLTTSNILTELNKVYNALPSGVRKKGKDNLVIFMSYEAAALYEMNLQAQGVNTSADSGVMKVYGIEIKPVGGLSNSNTIVIGARNNFYVGTDLQSDFNEIKLIDMRETTGDDAVRFIMKMKIDVTIAYANEVVYYRIPA
jgi:hypothetical protein